MEFQSRTKKPDQKGKQSGIQDTVLPIQQSKKYIKSD
jgi:hypothetical protein